MTKDVSKAITVNRESLWLCCWHYGFDRLYTIVGRHRNLIMVRTLSQMEAQL